jgi:hypothetical protein
MSPFGETQFLTHITILFRILASQNAGEQRTRFLSAERIERDL